MQHAGIQKCITEFRKRFYFPDIYEKLRYHIKNCATCIQTKPARPEETRAPMEPISLESNEPGEIMMVDLVGPFPPSGRYTQVLTAMDVFSRYLFTAPLAKVDAQSVSSALINIMNPHSYVPNKIISDKGTVFVSEIFTKMTEELKLKIEHATVKHPQTIGALERCHASLERYLNVQTGKNFSNWHRRLSFATYAYNTTYHTTIGTTPTQVFHGREPIRPLDIRFQGTKTRIP